MVLVIAVATATSACSAGDGSDIAPEPASDEAAESENPIQDPSVDEPEEPDEAAASQDPASDVPFDSGDGWFEIDGERYEAEWVVRCMPQHLDIEEPHEDDLELIAYAGGQTFFWLELSSQEVVLTPDDDRNYTALYAHPSLSRDGEGGREEFGDTGFATGPDGAWYDEVGPQRFTNDVGLVDTVTIGALLEQIREVVISRALTVGDGPSPWPGAGGPDRSDARGWCGADTPLRRHRRAVLPVRR
jgi:hypothetical protein